MLSLKNTAGSDTAHNWYITWQSKVKHTQHVCNGHAVLIIIYSSIRVCSMMIKCGSRMHCVAHFFLQSSVSLCSRKSCILSCLWSAILLKFVAFSINCLYYFSSLLFGSGIMWKVRKLCSKRGSRSRLNIAWGSSAWVLGVGECHLSHFLSVLWQVVIWKSAKKK